MRLLCQQRDLRVLAPLKLSAMLRERALLIDLHLMGGLAPGEVLAGHRIEAVAGRGGMGVVYRATQLALDRTVALKVIAPGLLEDQTMRARFMRESKVAASIDHPNVIPIYYAGEEDGVAYIAMRYVAGDDLRTPGAPRGAAAARARGADRRPGRRGARRGARRRARAPRRQARQRPARPRRPRLSDRLRAHQARALDGRGDEARALGRDARLRRAGADPRRARRCARGRVRARLPAVLHAHRRGPVPARDRRGEAVGAPLRPAAEAQRVPARRKRSTR